MLEMAMRYRFGECELSPASHELFLSGQSSSVEPQVFDLICYLVKERDRLVTRDELIEVVWGGRIVSDSAVSARISAARSAIGDDGTAQRWIRTLPRRGFRFVGDVDVLSASAASAEPEITTESEARQRVRFCRSSDGIRIAFATSGNGYPLVRAGHWLTHLEHDWRSPIWRPFLNELNRNFRVTRYDQRGNGLSQWEVDDFSLDRFVEDLEVVVDAEGLNRFALYGTSQGAPIAVAYASRHPKRISHLILQGGYRKGRLLRMAKSERAQGEAILALIRHGWGKRGSPFIQAFSTMFIPGGSREQIESVAELQRLTTSPDNAARIRAAVDRFDVTDLLSKVSAPTMVLHARDDGIQPLEEGRELAAGISGAEFVMLESANHMILPQEPAWSELFAALHAFVLTEDQAPAI